MNKKVLCAFDLDGTLYPKESRITHEIRRRVISNIASKNSISFDTAENLYKDLPQKHPNPYKGLESLHISGILYQEIFNSIDIESYIHKDRRLITLFEHLSELADIVIVSFAPKNYINRMLKNLGIHSFVKCVFSVTQETFYSKDTLFCFLGSQNDYDIFFAIGDDLKNDIEPAKNAGFKTFLVNFEKDGCDIYSVINKLNNLIMGKQIPRVMRVENISSCNESCIICPYKTMKRRKGTMTKELYEKIVIEHSKSVDDPKLIFPASIGEPFGDSLFFDKIIFARNYYSNISTFTNATLLSKEVFLKYVQSGGTELILTLHGFSQKMHSYITKSNYYNTVRNNIEIIAETNYGLVSPITLFLDIYADNSEECSRFVYKMSNLGVIANRIDLEKTHSWGGRINNYSKKEMHNRCSRIYEQFGVQHNGFVVPCCIDVEGEYILGDASKQTLNEIFSSKKYQQLVSLEQQGLIRNNALCALCNINS